MLADWFAGREIATAMAVFINSWPAGIAISLMLLPAIGATFGLHAVNLTVAGLILIGLCLVTLVYRAPDASAAVEGERGNLITGTICAVLPIVVALGILCGLPAGAIMSLPARVLEPKMRPIGMGLFYTVYYAGMLAGPAIGGKLSTSVGSASAALDFGAVALLACPVILWLFRRIVAGRYRPAVSPT